jgi:hypothetical protein
MENRKYKQSDEKGKALFILALIGVMVESAGALLDWIQFLTS